MTTTNSHGFSETAPPPPVSKQRRPAPIYRRRDVHVLLLTALLVALLAFLALAATEADEGDVIVAAANSAQNSHSATLLTDGRVLVAGGWSGTTAIATADLFDADARTWVPIAPLLTARIFHAATRLSDGRVLVAGGWDNNGDILSRDNGNTLTVGAHRVRAVVRNSARRSTRAPSRLTRLTSVAGSAIIRSDRDGRHETGVEPGV